jgi:hypothetical protein
LLCFTFTHTQSEKLNAKRKILATMLLQPAGGGGGGTDTGFKRPFTTTIVSLTPVMQATPEVCCFEYSDIIMNIQQSISLFTFLLYVT